MTYPFVFANESGNQPASQLDTMFNIVGEQGNIPTTATGTNNITMTPGANFFVPTSYTNGQLATFKAAATSTGPVTAQLGTLALVQVFMPSGIQAQSGDIVINTNYLVQFLSSLNGGAGGWQVINGTTATAVAAPLGGGFKNLKLITTSNTTLTPTADEIIVENAAGGTVRLRTIAPAVTSSGSVGTANGIVAAVTLNTWYAFWFIYNPNAVLSTTNPGGWLDTNFTTPTPPAGYTYWMRAGAFLTDAATNLNRTVQFGNRAQYIAGGATTPVLPQMIAGSSGNPAIPTWTAVSTAGFVPPTASDIKLVLWTIATSFATEVIAAPNNGYGNAASVVNPAPLQAANTAGTVATVCSNTIIGQLILESVNVFYASNAGAQSGLSCLGWVDNL